MRLDHAQAMWCSLRVVRPNQALWRTLFWAEQEKQSSLPPTRWRSEWKESEENMSKVGVAGRNSVPTVIPNLPPGKNATIASYQRITLKMSAQYRKKRCMF